ncbi:hypothetical protein AB1Y20_006790 [Prymnesium parvum]|uniref:JmjC domain-containing protein n=1 Tax=Prymnesium parvum TaxID=97485 RepID=A0AB34J1S8_PRYPA
MQSDALAHEGQRPFILLARQPASPPLPLEDVFPAQLLRLAVEFFPRGALSPASNSRRVPLERALERMRLPSPGATPYALLTVPPRRWRSLLTRLDAHEPHFVTQAHLRPEGECAAAVGPANRSWQFERELRWRIMALGGAVGTGTHLHQDRLPLASWHHQVRGRKRWLLCRPGPSHEYCGGHVDGFAPDYSACPQFNLSSCEEHTLGPGEGLFFPERWWHQTLTLDAVTLSVSRSLLMPTATRQFAAVMRSYCNEAIRVAPDVYARMCEALQPCLLRLSASGIESE